MVEMGNMLRNLIFFSRNGGARVKVWGEGKRVFSPAPFLQALPFSSSDAEKREGGFGKIHTDFSVNRAHTKICLKGF